MERTERNRKGSDWLPSRPAGWDKEKRRLYRRAEARVKPGQWVHLGQRKRCPAVRAQGRNSTSNSRHSGMPETHGTSQEFGATQHTRATTPYSTPVSSTYKATAARNLNDRAWKADGSGQRLSSTWRTIHKCDQVCGWSYIDHPTGGTRAVPHCCGHSVVILWSGHLARPYLLPRHSLAHLRGLNDALTGTSKGPK